MFQNNYTNPTPNFSESSKLKLKVKIHDEYPQISSTTDISKLSDSIAEKMAIKKPLGAKKKKLRLQRLGLEN